MMIRNHKWKCSSCMQQIIWIHFKCSHQLFSALLVLPQELLFVLFVLLLLLSLLLLFLDIMLLQLLFSLLLFVGVVVVFVSFCCCYYLTSWQVLGSVTWKYALLTHKKFNPLATAGACKLIATHIVARIHTCIHIQFTGQ